MAGKLQNIKAIKEMIAGTHKSQNRIVHGYEGKKTIADEDVIERFEDGKPKVWIETKPSGVRERVEQHNGFRSRKAENSILDFINEALRVPETCPKCESKMKGVDEERLNLKFWFMNKHCFGCQLKEESMIRAQGKEAWSEYSRKKLAANAESWFKDTDKEVEMVRNSLKLQFVQNADGDLAEYDQTAFFEKFDSDYKKFKKQILENLEG